MHGRLSTLFRTHPFASTTTLFGIVLACLGLVLGNLQEQDFVVGIIGDIVAVIGTILATIASAYSFGQAAGSKSITDRIDILMRQLTACSAHITQAVHQASNDQTEIAMARIAQAINTLSVVSTDLEKLAGGTISKSTQELISSRREIEEFASKFDSLNEIIDEIEEKSVIDPQAMPNEIGDLRSIINSIVTLGSTNERVPCPRCSKSLECRMPLGLGRTVRVSCQKCDHSFDVHRGPSSVFAGQPAGQGTRHIKKMDIPDAAERERILDTVFDRWSAGEFETGDDVYQCIGEFKSNSTFRAPLLYSLFAWYGPLSTISSNGSALRDSSVVQPGDAVSKDAWIRTAHVAWLSQATYRILNQCNATSDELNALFFDVPNAETQILVTEAIDIAQKVKEKRAAGKSLQKAVPTLSERMRDSRTAN